MKMKWLHYSVPLGQTHERNLKLGCPYSVSLRWTWRERMHQFDWVPYGQLEDR